MQIKESAYRSIVSFLFILYFNLVSCILFCLLSCVLRSIVSFLFILYFNLVYCILFCLLLLFLTIIIIYSWFLLDTYLFCTFVLSSTIDKTFTELDWKLKRPQIQLRPHQFWTYIINFSTELTTVVCWMHIFFVHLFFLLLSIRHLPNLTGN
jgi:hypothetical protein